MTGSEETTASPSMPALDTLTTREAYMAAVRLCFRESGLTYRAVVRRLEASRATGRERYQPRKENTFQDLVAKGTMPKVWVDDQGLATLPQLLFALGYSAEQREQWKKAWARIEAASGPRNAASPASALGSVPVPTPVPVVEAAQPSVTAGSGRERLRGSRRRALSAMALIVAATAATVGWTLQGRTGTDPQEWHVQTANTSGQSDGQCIGITDGRFAFGSNNAIVLGLLAALRRQNAMALTGPHIDVALNVTLTDVGTPCTAGPAPAVRAGGPDCAEGAAPNIPPDTDIFSSENVTAAYTELRGALMAQCEYNNVEGHKPKLRILIANAGNAYQYAVELAGRETELADRDPQFAAVLGLYQSRESTLLAEQVLNAHRIPIVLSAASADGITVSPTTERKPFDTLVRLAAPNARETERIVTLLTHDLHKSHPCLLGSTTGTDNFATNWTADLSGHWKDAQGSQMPTSTYDASSPTADVRAELTGKPGACGAPGAAVRYDAIVFSGRAQDLQYVLQKLRDWRYPSTVPVIGGDDLSNLVANPSPAKIGDTDDRTIYFADFGFSTVSYRSPYYFEQFADFYSRVLGSNIATGHLYTAFNAVWLLGESAATVNAASGAGITVGGQQMRENISLQIRGTCGPSAVRGASGMISFDAHGDPMRGLIVINRIDGSGHAFASGFGDTTDGVPDLATLSNTMAQQHLQCAQS